MQQGCATPWDSNFTTTWPCSLSLSGMQQYCATPPGLTFYHHLAMVPQPWLIQPAKLDMKQRGWRQRRSLKIRRAVLAQLCRRVEKLDEVSSSSHMYIYMFMFPLLKLASANSQVTLVTSSGAFKNLSFRKVWFYLVKPLLLGANVCKTLRPARCPPCRPLDPGGTLAGVFCALFRTFCTFWTPWRTFSHNFGRFGRCFFVFVLHLAFYVVFFAFWTSRGPSRTPKNHENHDTVIKNQGFANFKKIALRDCFWHSSGPLWVPFWSPLRSLGLLLALPGRPKRSKSRKKKRKNEVQNRTGRSEGPKARQRCPRTSKIDAKSSKNRLKMKRKSDVEELTLQKNIRSIDRLRALALQNKHANFTKDITSFSYLCLEFSKFFVALSGPLWPVHKAVPCSPALALKQRARRSGRSPPG